MNHLKVGIRRIVFSDFDNTITDRETFVANMKKIAPEMYEKLAPEMYALRLTIRQGVRMLLESIPSNRYPEMLANIRKQRIRPGFGRFLDFLDARDVPMVVVSGGLCGLVIAGLGNFQRRVRDIHAADVNTDGERLQVISEFEAGDELVAKAKIMALYEYDESVAIGDSYADLNLAMKSDIVFARDKLCDYLDERGKTYIRWQDFDDIRIELEKVWS